MDLCLFFLKKCFFNIIEGNAITVGNFVMYSYEMSPRLLREACQKGFVYWLPNQSPKRFFRTYSRHGRHGCDIRLKRQEMKVLRFFLKAKDGNIARNVVLVSPCFCSFNLYNFGRKFFPLLVNYQAIMLVFCSASFNLLKV